MLTGIEDDSAYVVTLGSSCTVCIIVYSLQWCLLSRFGDSMDDMELSQSGAQPSRN